MSGDYESAGHPPGGPGQPRMSPQWVLQNAKSLGINYDTLPHPPFWASLFGYSENWYILNVASTVMAFSTAVRRELTQEETDAISQHTAKSCYTRSLEPPAALGTAYLFERRGRAVSRFPFYTPKPTSFNPDTFPSQSFALLRNNFARQAWNATRFGVYAFLSHLLVMPLFSSYAMTVWATSMRLDPRLADLRSTIEHLGKQGRLEHPRSAGLPNWQVQARNEDPSVPDAPSPYSGNSQAYGDSSANEGPGTDDVESADQGYGSEAWARNREIAKPPQSYGGYHPPAPSGSRGSRQGPANPPSAESAFSEGSDEDDLFDDASPVAPSVRGRGPETGGRATSGGSAWDRIRRQAMSSSSAEGSSASQGPSQQEGSWSEERSRPGARGARTEAYTYSPADEDKAYAKEQAQKEFDAMLERERRGEGR
ncbi:hypothetical protein VTK73DRAFT_7868 [Phialemonium thermophilum]|uniref:Uncharacterized protein n=1 Tax=Phialemonium thermophilum TaxID=223376 RepID=A0ABR3WBU1_9PEZI